MTGDWHDVAALGQLVFWASYHAFGGLRGLVVAQTVAAAIAFGALAHGLSRETSRGGALAVSAIVLAGSLAAVMVTAAALFSLAFFAVLLALLESGPTRRSIWWSVPLLALWGNLHGGVLAGWALLACYLVFSRGRREPGLVILVLAAATVALGANPSLWHTPDYYRGVFHSEVARRGDGLWAPLGFNVLDLLLIAAAVSLGALVFRRWDRIRLWEIVAIVGLVAATVHVARNGVSLLFVAAYPAARGLQLRSPQPASRRRSGGDLRPRRRCRARARPRRPGLETARAHRCPRAARSCSPTRSSGSRSFSRAGASGSRTRSTPSGGPTRACTSIGSPAARAETRRPTARTSCSSARRPQPAGARHATHG